VLRRGTLFAQRAQRLYELYSAASSLEELRPVDRDRLERDVFRQSLDEVWAEAQRFWEQRDPCQNERAARDPKHRMALCFRWYLGQASRWAIDDVTDRQADFQIWCGPAMGAFNDWVRGSFLEELADRTVAQIGCNLLEGAAVVTRAHQLRSLGLSIPATAFHVQPRPLVGT
jgi:trans-AT polyketide synthase, acyltransferase and oxidoreductase domains